MIFDDAAEHSKRNEVQKGTIKASNLPSRRLRSGCVKKSKMMAAVFQGDMPRKIAAEFSKKLDEE